MKFLDLAERKLAIIGLGYVGLPLAVEFGKKRPVMGFDVKDDRVTELRSGRDLTLETSSEELKQAHLLSFTSTLVDIAWCDTFIIAVPTPIDAHKQPDLMPLIRSSEMIGSILKAGDIIVYESTVYPGAVEEVCVPVLEEKSGLKFNHDFYVGYSPERVSPGDKQRRLPSIKKITSGSTLEAAEVIDQLYNEIIEAGTYRAPSIKVAEAAKVVENTQRDLNIALMNELAKIFNRLGIDTEEVLKAAETKWNFLPFRPGLVGGHCIGVDPYYLAYKALSIGYHPEIILAGRRLNDSMGTYVVAQLVKKMLQHKIHVDGASVLVMGVTFKENCPDIRNSRVIDIIQELEGYNVAVDVHDPWANAQDVENEYGLRLLEQPLVNSYDAIVLAVGHKQYRAMKEAEIRALGKSNHVLYDLKHVLPIGSSDLRL